LLSIIVYGRNDGHGTNLSKRAALSLNALASVLSRQDDEIIFVDYNTADDLPTYPETVADTLTDWAKKLIKVIRVRPHHHACYKPHTDMFVIEAIARNIAIRRVNSLCEWVLCTNTDMIVNVEAETATSLTDVASTLEKGLYHVPRFELPESLWESFDRYNPTEARSFLRKNAAAMGLEVPVMGPSDIIYDYCGDFQLLHIDLLKEINGFDETMLLKGWCDPNIARRLQKHGYTAQSLLPAVKGYHCGHHRGFEAPDTGGRSGPSKNNAELYFYNLNEIIPPYQPKDWGCLAQSFEAFNLNERLDFKATLLKLLPTSQNPLTPISYPPEYRKTIVYQPETVLPFIADVLWLAPPDMNIVLVGVNTVFAKLLSDLALKIGLAINIITLTNEQSLDPKSTALADLILMDFGLDEQETQSWTDNALEQALQPMDSTIDCLITQEAQRLQNGKPHRRFVFINAERTLKQGASYENQLWFYAKLAPKFHIAIVPLQSRVSYGYLKQPGNQFRLFDLCSPLGKHPHFSHIPSKAEITTLYAQVRYLCAHISTQSTYEIAPEFLKPNLLALIDILLENPTCLLSKAALAAIQKESEKNRASVRLREAINVPFNSNRPTSNIISGFSNYKAWDNTHWLEWAKQLGGDEEPQASVYRSGHNWAQIQTLYSLNTLNLLNGQVKIAINAKDCSRMISVVADRAYKLEYLADIEAPFENHIESNTDTSKNSISTLPIVEGQFDVAISFMHPMTAWGSLILIPTLLGLSQRIKIDGTILLEHDVRLTNCTRPSCPSGHHFVSGTYQKILSDLCGLSCQDDTDFSYDEVSFDCMSRQQGAPAYPRMVSAFPKGLTVTPAVTCWRKKTNAPLKNWQQAHMEILALENGTCYFQIPQDRDLSKLASRGIPMFPGDYKIAFSMDKKAPLTIQICGPNHVQLFETQKDTSFQHIVHFKQKKHSTAFWSPIWITLTGKDNSVLEITKMEITLETSASGIEASL